MPFSILTHRRENYYVRPSLEYPSDTDSIASDETAPNNPGPGRNVGRLYDALGDKFERFLGRKTVQKPEKRSIHVGLQLVRYNSPESIASDATGPNNPGPGRNLGRLYDSLGANLENFWKKRAGRLDRGPEAVAREIRDLRQKSAGDDSGNWSPTFDDMRSFKKLCRRLLRYCRSQDLSTQLRALEEVTRLAVDDPYVREVLANVLGHSPLVPKYKEKELHVSCSKAVISIKDNTVHELWSNYGRSMLDTETMQLRESLPDVVWSEERLIECLRDPDLSFLVGRLLGKWIRRAPSIDGFERMWECYLEVAAKALHAAEWDSLRAIFDNAPNFALTQNLICSKAGIVMQLAQHFPVFSRYITLRTPAVTYDGDGELTFSSEDLEDNFHWILHFLWKLCDSEDLAVQLRYIQELNVCAPDMLQETVLGDLNEIIIAFVRICHATYCDVCDQRYVSPAILGEETYLPEASVILYYYFRGNSEERALAKLVLTRSIEQSRYLKNAFALLLSEYDDVTHSLGLSLSLRKSMVLPLPSQCDYFTRTRRQFQANNLIILGEASSMQEGDTLHMHGKEFWLEIHGNERPFSATGHFPVLAGHDVSGRELFVARAFVVKDGWPKYTYVADGARSVSITEKGRKKTTSRFEVLVLRHDPSDISMQTIPKGAILQTGPVFWLHEEDEIYAY